MKLLLAVTALAASVDIAYSEIRDVSYYHENGAALTVGSGYVYRPSFNSGAPSFEHTLNESLVGNDPQDYVLVHAEQSTHTSARVDALDLSSRLYSFILGHGTGGAAVTAQCNVSFTLTSRAYFKVIPAEFGAVSGQPEIAEPCALFALEKRINPAPPQFIHFFYRGECRTSSGAPAPAPIEPYNTILDPGYYLLYAHADNNGPPENTYGGNGGVARAEFTVQITTLSPPTAVTLPVSNVTQTSALLNGMVDPNGNTVTAQFEYGLASSPEYTGSISVPVTEGNTAQPLSAPLAGLEPNTEYRYRLLVQSGGDTVSGGDVTFILRTPTPADDVERDDDTTCPKSNAESGPATAPISAIEPGMASYSFHTKLASLKIIDTPVAYTPPYGRSIPFTATYTQRTTSQPAAFDYSNLGRKWNSNWITYITDSPTDATAISDLRRPGGGRVSAVYLGSDSSHHQYQLMDKPGMRLRRALAATLPYEILHADGSKDVYGQSDGSSVAPRKIFLTQRIDSAGNTTTLAYDASMRLTRITDALGQETAIAYELPGDPLKITRVTDPFGRFATFEYDAAGRLIKITDVIGIESSFTYQGDSDFIDSMTTPYGTTTFTNTEKGSVRRVTATDPAGDTEVLESNAAQTAAISASEPAHLVPRGMTVSNAELNTRNSFYWNKKQWREAPNDYLKAHIYHWLKNADLTTMSGFLESEKQPLQSRIWYNHPDQANPQVIGANTTRSKIGRVIEGGTQLVSRSVTPLGKVSSETDPVGRTTNFQYSPDGVDLLKISQTVSGNQQTLGRTAYSAQHRPLAVADANARSTIYAWNAQGQILSVRNARNETTSYTYYSDNEPGKQRKGRLSSINGGLAGDADTVNFDYDAVGNVARVTGPDDYFLRFSYDPLDRLTRVTFPDDTYTETTYLALDPQTTRDRLGRLTHYVYNSIRQLISVTDPAQRQIQYSYCDCGDLDQLIDAMGRITTWRYDIAGRVTAKKYADGSQIKYAYEPLSGRLSTITDEKGQIKTRSYNLDSSLAGITYTNEEHYTPNVLFSYDPNYRRLTQMIDGMGITNYAYNAVGGTVNSLGAGQLATVDGPLPDDTLSYTYDELGRNTGYAINGVGETRTFDPLGRLLSAVNPLGTFGYSYVGATSRMDEVTYPNGMTAQYTYHPLIGDFRLKDIIHTLPGDTLLSRHSYEYNFVGNITRWTQISPQAGLNRSWLCGYDDADQLTSVASQDPETFANLPAGQYAYSYDSAGNRLTETIDGVTATADVNALNQLTSLTTSGASTLPHQTHEWDAEDRLTAINYTGTDERTEFEYDGNGRRLGVREKQGAAVIDYRRFAWRGLKMAEERDATGTAAQRRYFGHGMQTSGSGDTMIDRFFALDHLGSARELISSAEELTSAYDFDPWGRRSLSVGSLDESSLAFTGHWFHSTSAFALAPYRSYNAEFGRWNSRDPIGEAGGVNSYDYVVNNPIGLIDFSGLLPEPPPTPGLPDARRDFPQNSLENSIGMIGGKFVGAGTSAVVNGKLVYDRFYKPLKHISDYLDESLNRPEPSSPPECPSRQNNPVEEEFRRRMRNYDRAFPEMTDEGRKYYEKQETERLIQNLSHLPALRK